MAESESRSFVRAARRGEKERRDESGGRRKRAGGDRWPFQTMRNSGDKGGVRERIGGAEKRNGKSGWEKKRESEMKSKGKIEAETTFSRKGRRECNE